MKMGKYSQKTISRGAGNSCLHRASCHLPQWKSNIPRSQFCRLKEIAQDYREQGTILKNKFREKWYDENQIEDSSQTYLKDYDLITNQKTESTKQR